MNAKELRIGNYVLDGRDVEAVNARMISMLEKGEAEFDPIPLTEEWLLKFGFVGYTVKGFSKNGIELSYITRDDCFQFEFRCPQSDWRILDIKYAHQLQNLYFALTGEELELKDL